MRALSAVTAPVIARIIEAHERGLSVAEVELRRLNDENEKSIERLNRRCPTPLADKDRR